jgi:hypothetical protein
VHELRRVEHHAIAGLQAMQGARLAVVGLGNALRYAVPDVVAASHQHPIAGRAHLDAGTSCRVSQ